MAAAWVVLPAHSLGLGREPAGVERTTPPAGHARQAAHRCVIRGANQRPGYAPRPGRPRASCSIISASASSPAAKQNRSKLADMLASASVFIAFVGIAVDVRCSFTALLSFRGISTPSLQAQGEQRRSSIFNNDRDIPSS